MTEIGADEKSYLTLFGNLANDFISHGNGKDTDAPHAKYQDPESNSKRRVTGKGKQPKHTQKGEPGEAASIKGDLATP